MEYLDLVIELGKDEDGGADKMGRLFNFRGHNERLKPFEIT